MTRNRWFSAFLIAFVVLAFVSRRIFLNSKLIPKTSPSANYPTLVDLGDGVLGDIAIGQFSIQNGGEQDLILTHFQSSCGCSGLEVNEGTNWVTPGEVIVKAGQELPCRVRLNVLDQATSGRSVRIGFATNDPTKSNAMIEARLNGIRGMVIRPSAALFGQLLLGETKEIQLDLYDVGDTKMTYQKVTFPENPDLQIRLRNPDSHPEKTKPSGRFVGVIDVRLTATQVGDFRHVAELHFISSHGKSIVSPLIIQGRTVEEFTLTPKKITLPRQSGSGKTYQTYCLIKSADGRDFEVICSTISGVRTTLLPHTDNSGIRTLEVEILESNRNARTIELPITIRTERGDRILQLKVDMRTDE